MGYYSVIRPCVVGKLHYATVPVYPIEVDDEVAGALVDDGSLEPYCPSESQGQSLLEAALEAIPDDQDVFVAPSLGEEAAESSPVRRGRRKD